MNVDIATTEWISCCSLILYINITTFYFFFFIYRCRKPCKIKGFWHFTYANFVSFCAKILFTLRKKDGSFRQFSCFCAHFLYINFMLLCAKKVVAFDSFGVFVRTKHCIARISGVTQNTLRRFRTKNIILYARIGLEDVHCAETVPEVTYCADFGCKVNQIARKSGMNWLHCADSGQKT